jgi:hypothetical protein
MTAESMASFMASGTGAFVILLFAFWALIWKGIALWKAAQRNAKAWYIILLILNTLGILEIIYIFLIAKDDNKCCK